MSEINDYIAEKNKNLSYVTGIYKSETACDKASDKNKLIYDAVNNEFISLHLGEQK